MDALTQRAVDEVRAALGARFEPTGEVRRSIKCALVFGALAGAPAVAKLLVHRDPMWRWYFDRELALYRAFAREPPPFRVPALLAAEPARGLMVLERLAGPALCPHRRASAPLPEPTLRALIATRDAVAGFARGLALAPADPPPPAELASMRARLLEDPTAPLGWFTEGFERARSLGILTDAGAARMARALANHPAVVFAHGDLLLRNAVYDRDGAVVLVDWECAGGHPEAWDLALVWVGVDAANRPAIEQAARRGGAAAWAAFLAACAFGLAREIKFRGHSSRRPPPASDGVLARLRAELVAVLTALAREGV